MSSDANGCAYSPLCPNSQGNENQGNKPVLGCEILFSDEDRALALQAMIEKQTGAPCPCKQGQSCPILPAGALPVALQQRPPVVGLSA